MKYTIIVRENLEKIVEVECDTKEQAMDIVKSDYRHEKIVLDSNDFVDVQFTFK